MPTKRITEDVVLSALEIGRRVRRLRKKREWTCSELAVACGIEESRLSRIELGKKFPTMGQAILLSLRLRRTLEWLLLGMPTRAKLWTFFARKKMAGRAKQQKRAKPTAPRP